MKQAPPIRKQVNQRQVVAVSKSNTQINICENDELFHNQSIEEFQGRPRAMTKISYTAIKNKIVEELKEEDEDDRKLFTRVPVLNLDLHSQKSVKKIVNQAGD